jgi:hypothetical protein
VEAAQEWGEKQGDVCKQQPLLRVEAEAQDWAGPSPAFSATACADGPGAAVRMLCGLATVGPRNAAGWRRHVEAVDGVVRVCGPGLCAMAAIAILGGAADVLLPPLPSAL